jgi:hypothetical protein
MDVALASGLGIVGHLPSSTGVARDAWRPKLCALKALPASDHAQPRHEALEADHVPLIDLAQLSACSSHDAARTKAALAEACHDWGFFQVRKQCLSHRKKLLSFLTLILSLIKFWRKFWLQVVNHGVSQELVHSFRAQCRDLFSLPLEQKLKAEREGASLYGYSFRPHTGPSEVLLVPGWDAPLIADYGRKLLYPRSAEHFW